MTKNNNNKLVKLIKYYSLINHNLIYDNKSINRYKFAINSSAKTSRDRELLELRNEVEKIKNCKLRKSAKNIVFSDGNPNSRIMIIGEGPGANEDMEGMPFIGRAGHLLDKMLQSIKKSRKNVYITNVVNYRPPENRSPTEEEIQKYIPFLIRHIEIINPKILLLLGSTALNTIIGNDEVISNVRGKWIEKEIGKRKTSILASFHPAFLIRQPTQKAMSWVDLKMIRKKILDLKINIEK